MIIDVVPCLPDEVSSENDVVFMLGRRLVLFFFVFIMKPRRHSCREQYIKNINRTNLVCFHSDCQL